VPVKAWPFRFAHNNVTWSTFEQETVVVAVTSVRYMSDIGVRHISDHLS
jgi:hypothetical protein